MVKVFEEQPQAGILNPKICYYERPGRIQSLGMDFSLWSGVPRMRGRKMVDGYPFIEVEEVSSASGCAMMIRREVIERIGVLDEDFFAYVEDIDYCLRAKRAGFKIMCVPLAKVLHKEDYSLRKKKDQSLRYYLSSRNMLLLFYKHGRWFHWVTFLPNYLIRWISRLFVLSIMRNDLRSAFALFGGILSFVRYMLSRCNWRGREKYMIDRIATSRVNLK
jgi:GT2 family glycosyltransferase